MREIPFTKMHGCGNDFVVINCLEQDFDGLPDIARQLCRRRFGVGADQMLTIDPSELADFRMRVYNADGGEE